MPSGRGRRAIARRLAVSVVLLLAVGLVLRGGRGRGQGTARGSRAPFGGGPAGDEKGGTIMCDDCAPACDEDGVTTPNQSCTFKYTGCVNKPSGSCMGATLKSIKGKVQHGAS